ncbi:sugar transport protein 13, partial [Tanacetum coccineum]
MEDKETNKRDKVPGDSSSGSLLDKIRNIDGKIIKEGKLRTVMRGVVKPGTYVESLDGNIREKANESDSHMDDSYSIFGGEDVGMKPTSDDGAESGATINKTNSTSFAAILQRNPNKKTVKIQELRNPEVVEGAAVAIPIEAVEEVSSRFANTLYGYFIGNRLAFPLVENYVKNTWAKYGLKRIQLHEEFFMFQFNTKEGMESVMEAGPWLIRRVPLILNVWTPNTDLKKDVIKVAPLWVKLHHVPIVAYSEIGLSLITTQLGRPIMLDSYTSNMCLSSWGRNTYARTLIEFSAEVELKESIVIAIPLSDGKGHTLAQIDVEYEWTPPKCEACKVFDHNNDNCPKNPKCPKVDDPIKKGDDGFTMVKRKKSQQNQKKKQIEGVRLGKPALNLQYRKVDRGESSKKNDMNVNFNQGLQVNKINKSNAIAASTVNNVTIKNSFGVLTDDEEMGSKSNTIINEDSDDEQVDEEMVLDDRHESHVADSNLHKMCSLVFRHWDWSSNGAWCNKGTRIILGWNHNDVDIMVVTQDDQAVHARVWLKLEKKEVFCSFIYAHNRYNQRRSLWKGLSHHKLYVRDRPWCLLGDFNSTLYLDETTTGTSRIDIAMREFKECVDDIEVMDVQNSGLQFTWSQKPKGYDGILKKLDRIMSNQEFLTSFVGAHAIFKPYRISDHSPSILSIPLSVKSKPKPFKFYNIITKHERFLNIVKDSWCNNVSGFFMYRIVKKLKTMKKPLRKLLYEKGNLHDNVIHLRSYLDQIQTLIDKDPFNSILREKEADCVVEFNQAVLLEERFLKQKAKIHWLKEGDSNSAYFHKAVKSRVSRSRIDVVMNGDGLIFTNDKVPEAFVT